MAKIGRISGIKQIIATARTSERVLKLLLAFAFIITTFVIAINFIVDRNQPRVLVGILFLTGVFGLRYLLEIASSRLIYWLFAVISWVASVSVTYLSGGPESAIAVSVVLVIFFSWLFVGQAAVIVFSALTLIAAFLFPVQSIVPNSDPVSTDFMTASWIYVLSGAIFAFAGAAMIAISEIQDAKAADEKLRRIALAEKFGPERVDDPVENVEEIPGEDLLLEQLLSLTDAGVFLLDTENKVCRVNHAACHMLGFSEAEILGADFENFVRFEPKSGASDDIARMFDETGSSVFSRQLVRKDESLLPVKVRFASVRAGQSAPPYILQIVRDISDQNALMALMRDSEQKLSAFLENTRDAVYLKDLEGRYTMINEIGAAIIGKARSGILGSTDFAIFNEEDAARIRKYDRMVIESGSSQTEESVVLIDNAYKTFRTTRMPYFSQRGQITGVIGIMRDMSLRKRVEADLRTIALRYQALFESNSDGIIVLDLNGHIIDVSDLACRMVGYAKSDLIGTPMTQLAPLSEEGGALNWRQRLLENRQANIFEQNLLRQNGQIFPVEVNAGLVLDDEGKPLHIQVLFRDISDRRQVDVERVGLLENLRTRTRQIQTAFEVSKSISSTLDLRNLLNQTVEIIKQRFNFYYVGVFLIEKDHAVLAAGSGDQGRAMLAAGHRLPVAPSSMVGWCIQHKRARIALDVGKDPVHFDNPMTPKTRSELAMPLIVHSEVIGALTVQSAYPEAFNSEDVAVLQIMADQLGVAVQNARLHEQLTNYAGELEDRVLKRTFQLEELNRELESFSYSISHDLRAPLRAIHGYSNIIVDSHDKDLTAEVRDYLGKIKNNALKMGNLIDDILAFSRMGRQQVRKIELDPNELIEEVLVDLETEIATRKIEIRVDQLPLTLADPVLLKQVFANLIGNAVKFTRKEVSPLVKISCTSDNEKKLFTVQDNGVGFDMKYSDRLFGVFQRMHLDDEFEGTGVGLAIVQRIIQRHGGEIWFDAQEGAGATFYFSLPAQ